MRLIDADEVFEMADEFPAFEEGLADKTDLKDLLNICDTIEAKPVVHAHWVWDKKNKCWSCSACEGTDSNNYSCISVDSKYCPNCGAQMDEDKG